MVKPLTEEHKLLQKSAKDFVAEKLPVANLRKLRDEKSETGYDADLWREMVELGWASINIPEDFGGLGFGYQGLGLILEETGRELSASPLMSNVVLSTAVITEAASQSTKAELLGQIAGGETLIATAIDEGTHHDPMGITCKATATESGYRLDGSKNFVLDGHTADKIIVAARTSGESGDEEGISLFLLDKENKGLQVNRLHMVDSRNAARIILEGAEVGKDALIGEEGKAGPALNKALDIARICVAAEMLGATRKAFEMTIDWLKERKQFGVAIGTFQALQHRAAHMFSEIELCKAVVEEGLSAIDEDSDKLSLLASLAKARLGETLTLVSNEAVQLHGGIGVTDEHDIGLYLKRARVQEQTFGSSTFHQDRYATIKGY